MGTEPTKVLKSLVTDEKIKTAFEKIKTDSELAVKGCHYELILKDRYQDALNFYRDEFVPDEPVGRCISLDFGDEYQALVMSELKHNMSIALVSDITGEIVGIRMMSIMNKNDEHDTSDLKSEKFKLIEDFLNYLADQNDVFEYYAVEDVVHFFAIGVHKDYRDKGVGSKLMKAAISLVRNLCVGPVVITGEGSSNYSKRIYEKFGFDILAEVVFADYKVNGVVVFQNLGEHKFERLYGKIVS